jgi:hypothetical protein
MALHVADGSQILSQRASGPSLTIAVGKDGDETYGSCLARLSTPQLASRYLPVLETRYVDALGARYRQTSFAAHIAKTRSLVSFVELSVDARQSTEPTTVRLAPSEEGLAVAGNTLVRDGRTYLLFGSGGAFDGRSVTYRVEAGGTRTVYAAWLDSPAPITPFEPTRDVYASARGALTQYWQRRLRHGPLIDVPESRVVDAQRSLIVQNLGLTWRYSVGNPYQQFSYPEGVDVAQVLATNGFPDVARAILTTSLGQKPTRYPNWQMGQKLVGVALYYRLYRDRTYVEQVTPVLRAYVTVLARKLAGDPRHLLGRERYSSDIPDSVYGLHSQTVVWQGLRSMATVWSETRHSALAARCRRLAADLGTGLRRAVRASERRLSDGSLFLDVRLLDRVDPYDSVTASRYGSYWNLVMPYALASGFFPPGSPEEEGLFKYMRLHGSRLLGLVRAGAYSLYGLNPRYPASGVYGLNVARFLADNDRPDQLVLALYGQLALEMASGTFVSGEGISVAPLAGQYYRSMYLPPNGESNGSFLETLRLLLVHETRAPTGTPYGLQLAFATPRAWLAPGRSISVQRAPTSFGPVSFSMRSSSGLVRVSIDVPGRSRLRALELRVRLPHGAHVTNVLLDGRAFEQFDARREVIELPTRPGRLELLVRTRRG